MTSQCQQRNNNDSSGGAQGSGHQEEEERQRQEHYELAPGPSNEGRVEEGAGGGDIVVPDEHRDRTSQFKGVTWAKANGKWRATCKGRRLGYFPTEAAAAAAFNKYLADGVDPVKYQGRKGVRFDKGAGKWKAIHKEKYIGCYDTEEAAVQG